MRLKIEHFLEMLFATNIIYLVRRLQEKERKKKEVPPTISNVQKDVYPALIKRTGTQSEN